MHIRKTYFQRKHLFIDTYASASVYVYLSIVNIEICMTDLI